MTIYLKATHSSGRVHLRASDTLGYEWACVGARRGAATFHSRQDLAAKARADRYAPEAAEVVRVEEITKQEHAAAIRAAKVFFKVEFMGKAYTKSCSAEISRPYVCALGYDRPERIEWIAQVPSDERIEWLRRYAPDSVESALQIKAAGGYRLTHRAERGVWWYEDRAQAEEQLKLYQAGALRGQVFELLELR